MTNLIKGTLIPASECICEENRQNIQTILKMNNFPKNMIKRVLNKSTSAKQTKISTETPMIYSKIPYVPLGLYE